MWRNLADLFQEKRYGKNAEISPIQRLYAQYLIIHVKSFANLQVTSDGDVHQLLSKIEVEADKLMQLHASDSADYNKYLAIKAFTYLKRGVKECVPMLIFEIDFLEKALELLEPIKQQKEGVRHYTIVLTGIGMYYMNVKKYHEAIEYFKKEEQEFEMFKTKFSDIETAMDEFELFGFCDLDLINRPSFSQLHYNTMIYLYECYNALNDVGMKLKYVVPSIKGKIVTAPLLAKFYEIVPLISSEICVLFASRYFVQINHLLAGLMNQLVKHRRELPAEDQPGVKRAQAIISEWFVSWACAIIDYSIRSFKDKAFAKKYPISDEIYHFAELIDEETKIYENQFPCKPILIRKEFEKYLKRAVLWCQRAIDLYEDIRKKTDAKELMKIIGFLQCAMEDLKELK